MSTNNKLIPQGAQESNPAARAPMTTLAGAELRAVSGGPIVSPTSGIPIPPPGAKS